MATTNNGGKPPTTNNNHLKGIVYNHLCHKERKVKKGMTIKFFKNKQADIFDDAFLW